MSELEELRAENAQLRREHTQMAHYTVVLDEVERLVSTQAGEEYVRRAGLLQALAELLARRTALENFVAQVQAARERPSFKGSWSMGGRS